MATDKSAPALPKVGEVWVQAAADINTPGDGSLFFGDMTARLVVGIETGRRTRVIFDQVDTVGQDSDQTCSVEEWTAFTKRAVRVDDKEAGR